MTLSQKEKQMIEDFVLGNTDINPESSIAFEDMTEVYDYANFIMNRKILQCMYKICGKVTGQ